MITTTPNVRMSWLAFATAGVTLLEGAFLIATFVAEVPTNGPYNLGRTTSALSALANVMIAALVIYVSRPAERELGSRAFVRVVAAASIIGAASSILLVFGLLAFEISTVISATVLLLQAAWMLWANTRLYELGVFSRLLSRCGQLVGGGLWLGLLLVGASALLPYLTLPQVIVLGIGLFIGGGVWLAWPFWFVMLGLHLLSQPAAVPPRRRGRRKATSTG